MSLPLVLKPHPSSGMGLFPLRKFRHASVPVSVSTVCDTAVLGQALCGFGTPPFLLSALIAARGRVGTPPPRTRLEILAASFALRQLKFSRHGLSKLHPHGRKQIGRLENDSLVVVRSPRQPGSGWRLCESLVNFHLKGAPGRPKNILR